MRRLRPIPIAAALVVLAALWLVRPIWHGLAMFFWTQPIVWLPPILLLGAGGLLLRRSQRSWTHARGPAHRRAPAAATSWRSRSSRSSSSSSSPGCPGRSSSARSSTTPTYEAIAGLPAGGQVRLVPREVAEVNASSAFNSPTETLTNFRIVNTDDGLIWTALRTPQGAFRIFSKKSQGLVGLDAEQTARQLG